MGVGSKVLVASCGVKVTVGGAVADGVSVRGGTVTSGVGASSTGGALTSAIMPRQ